MDPECVGSWPGLTSGPGPDPDPQLQPKSAGLRPGPGPGPDPTQVWLELQSIRFAGWALTGGQHRPKAGKKKKTPKAGLFFWSPSFYEHVPGQLVDVDSVVQ